MITTINFDTELDFEKSTPLHKRRILYRRHHIQKARKLLIEKGVARGTRWNLTAHIVEDRSGVVFNEYVDEFSLIV